MNMITVNSAKLGAGLLALLGLAACMMSPGKFTSSLDIRADRTFTFAYQGEVIITDLDDMPTSTDSEDEENADADAEAAADSTASSQEAVYRQVAMTDEEPGEAVDAAADENAPDSAEKIAKMQAIAESLMKEEGYRSVRYVGKNKFEIDYRLSGKLDHGFIFPFNPDAQAIFPFVTVEMRKDGRVKVSAPGFAENNDSKSAMGGGKGSSERNGIFTLTTNAEIISQNQEDGATTVPQGKQIQWKITPTTDSAPMAVLKFAVGK